MEIAVYNIDCGLMRTRVVTNYLAIITEQCREGEEFYLNCPPEATHIINNYPVIVVSGIPAYDSRIVEIKGNRNTRLSACDWTQTLDAPLTIEQRAAWATYRQALRDFPETCDPDNPVWPVAPS